MKRGFKTIVVLTALLSFGCASMGEKEKTGTAAGAATGAVRSALLQRGIDPGRMTVVGMGECCPISSDNATNRRVTMQLSART